ncbi:MAG: T9SS type A sorting domain-containing protein [Bacteroidales bacterium]|nr:T9SS type A sorting domain-containing protein [Bacteroidales bacterium]
MKNSYSRKLSTSLTTFMVVAFFVSFQVKADTLHVSSNITPEQMVQEILIGGGVVTSNITYTGNNISRGEFWGGPGNIGIEDGIILTSGNVTIAPGPNNAGNAGQDSGQPGDPDLTAIAGIATFDACVLEFDFIPQSSTVSFKYVFGSEEYHEYVNQQYNDAFGFFISGPGITGPYSNDSKNIALIPLSEIAVSINTVNCGNPYNCPDNCENCVFFVNNTQQFTQYDAFTTVLRAWATVIPCETYHIKLAIGDGYDHIYDSGVFLEANSFSSVGISSAIEYSQPDVNFTIEGCSDASILFTLSEQPDQDFYLPLTISGSAINGVDYERIPDSVFFQQGYTQAWMDIITIPDQFTEWVENIRIVYNSSLCGIDYDTILITLMDYKLSLDMTPDTIINCATQANIGIENINGFEPYSISWSTGDTTEYITVSPLISTTYHVAVTALCDSMTTDSIRVTVNGPKSNAGQDLSIPYGTNTNLQGSASQGSGEYTYSWEPADKLVNPTDAMPTTILMEQTTQFTLTVTDLAGGCQDIDQMVLFVTGGPLNVGPVAYPGAICPGESSHLFSYAAGGSENYSYSWTSSPPGFNSDIPDPIVEPLVTTTYYITINDGYNSVTGNVTVEVMNLPVPEAGENDTIWHGTVGYLNGSGSQGSGNYSWFWEPFNKLINPYSPTPTTVKLYETTLFRLSITDNTTGCVSAGEDLVTVVVIGGPLAVTADITDPVICRGETTQLHALPSGGNPDYTYSWSSLPAGFSSTEGEPFITPVLSTTYTVQVFDQFNYFGASVDVEVSQPPLVNLGTDILACPYDTVKLSVNLPGMTYYWSNGSDESSVSIGTTGIGFDMKKIWVRVENDLGCFGTDTIQVTFDFAQCSGVNEASDETYVYIYPNPTTGKVQVEWKGLSGNVDMQLSDIHGNLIFDQIIMAPPSGDYKGSFHLEGQPKGIYLLKLVGEEKVLVRKILLQ